MDAVKLEGTDCIAVAPSCFDLPLMQAVDVCETCKGKKEVLVDAGPNEKSMEECVACGGTGVERPRLITKWQFTEEEWQYMVEHPEARGVHLSICAAQTPPVLVTVLNPVEMWPETVVPLKKFMKNAQHQTQP